MEFVMWHEARQVPSWLIFDVGQMNIPLDTVLAGALRALIVAGVGALVVAEFKGIRLFIRLRRVAKLLRSVRNKTYEGFTGLSDMTLCDQAKQELDVALADIDRDSNRILKYSGAFRKEMEALQAEMPKIKDALFSDLFFDVLGYNSIAHSALDKSRNLEREFNRVAWKALAPWSFLLP